MHFLSKSDHLPVASETNVVFLVNFLSPNLVEVMRQISQQVKRLDILVSVPMEANRQFHVDSSGLNVIQQKSWTRRKVVSHPGGYQEELFVHFPLDTVALLKRIQPDCVVSLEMGMRSLLASLYRNIWNRRCRHVLSVYGSERSEAGRGTVRGLLRKRLLKRADVVTFNGPSCLRYLRTQGARDDKLLPWNYAADPAKAYRGEIRAADGDEVKLLTVSQLIERKGILPAALALRQWAVTHPEQRLLWTIAGTGVQTQELQTLDRPDNFVVELRGHCDPDQLRSLYAEYPINLFPTLGDEWGLVVDEALASGQIVIGSIHSQAVETLVHAGQNGWPYNPDVAHSLPDVLQLLIQTQPSKLQAMREYARQSVQDRTHVESAAQFVRAVMTALAR